MEWLLFSLIFALCGAWRVIDGEANRAGLYNDVVNKALVIGYSLLVAWLTVGTVWAVALTAVMVLSLMLGYQDWKDFGYMSMRFTGFAAIGALIMLPTYGQAVWVWPMLGLMAGLSYPLGAKFNIAHYDYYARWACGGVMLSTPLLIKIL